MTRGREGAGRHPPDVAMEVKFRSGRRGLGGVAPVAASRTTSGRDAAARHPTPPAGGRAAKVPGGFEPPIEVLQTSALPLGYGTTG